MTRLVVLAAFAAVVAACSSPGPSDGGGGGNGGGGGGGAGGSTPFEVFTLDSTASEATYFAMASDATQRRVGVAYYTPRGTETNVGHPDYNLKYVEWKDGVTSPVETIRFVQRKVGVSVAFHPTTGEPVVGYVGGAPGFDAGMSIYWFQSDAAIATRSAGAWTETIHAVTGADTSCAAFSGASAVSDRGFLVGLWPALIYDSTGKLYHAWRDCHDAQFPQQDWNGSDVELFESPGLRCLMAGGGNKQAWGGHLQFAMGPADQPALIYDQEFGTSDGSGQNVIFQRRNSDGTWTAAGAVMNVGATQTGASLAWDPTEGYGIAVLDRSANELNYTHSLNAVSWSSPDPVFGTGSGGWYPSLAMDPVNHEPAIAFYVCSAQDGKNESNCLADEDELRVTQRIANIWREVKVDDEGGYAPKIGFFASAGGGAPPKRFVAYRHPKSGVVKLAVER